MGQLSQTDLDAVVDLCVDHQLTRSLVIEVLDPAVQGQLKLYGRPADQFRADLHWLNRHAAEGWLASVLTQIESMLPPVADALDQLRAVRQRLEAQANLPRRVAIVAGIAGPTPSTEVRAALTTIAQTLRARLHPDHRAHVEELPAPDGRALLEAVARWRKAALEGLWIVLVGEAFEDPLTDELVLRSAEEQGLDASKLSRLVKAAAADWTSVVVEVADHASALAALDWGPCALRSIGPDATTRVAAGLLTTTPGPVTAAALAAATDGRTDRADVVLNQRIADDVAVDPHARLLVGYLTSLRDYANQLLLDRATRGDGGTARTLKDVYVPLHTRGTGDEAPDPRDLRGRLGHDREQAPPKTAHDRVAEHRCVFLVGDPGSGKSSFLRRLAHTLAEAALGDAALPRGFEPDPFPVLCELAKIKGEPSPQAILAHATGNLACVGERAPLPPAVVERALREGRLVLLLDGLDEVGRSADVVARKRRKQMGQAIARLAVGQAAKAQVVVTCRPAAARAGAAPGGPFQRFDLEPLTLDQIRLVAANWLRGRPAHTEAPEQIARRLVADLGNHEAVLKLARNPLALAMICVVLYRDAKARLPRDRNSLYDKLITLLLEDRERVNDARARERLMHLTDVAELWWAAGGTRSDETTVRADACAEQLVKRRGISRALADEDVRFFDDRAGLLVWETEERASRVLRFAHRSFVEYLVACRCMESATPDLLSHALDEGWREVALMYVAEYARNKGDRTPAWALVNGLLDQAEADGPWAARAEAACLAAECIEDWRDDAAAQVPDAIGDRIDAIQDAWLTPKVSKQVPTRKRARLFQFVGKHNRAVRTLDRWVWVPPSTFWRGRGPQDEGREFRPETPAGPVAMGGFFIQRWATTVAEVRRFVEAGGYEESQWWSPEGWAWRERGDWQSPAGWPVPGQEHQPAVGASWFEAEAWCAWASTQADLRPASARPIELATEAQWAYAARGPWAEGGSVRVYPWGAKDDPDRRSGADTRIGRPTPPGVFPRGVSVLGTWDQSGNVDEWCRDAVGDYDATPTPNPFRAAQTPDDERVLRGGAFDYVPLSLRVAFRNAEHPRWRDVGIGFRCVCVPAEDP